MRITNEDIIQSAKRQRQSVENRMSAEPWQSPRRNNGLVAAAVGIAASLVGFLAGFSLHAKMPIDNGQQAADNSLVIQHDTIMQVQTVRDTVYQTRIVTKYEKPMLAEVDDDTSAEQKACSMLCDEIPYELLASGR